MEFNTSEAAPMGMETMRKRGMRNDSPIADSCIDWGAINFTMHNTPTTSEFVLVPAGMDKAKIAEHMMNTWEMPAPGLLLRIIGSVEQGQVDSIQGVLEGIVFGVSQANGCIFSNGLDFGLASVVGNTINAARHRCQAPLIGIPSWSAVQGREQLVSSADVERGHAMEKGLKKKYVDAEPDENMETVSLQPVHTHFVMVKADESVLRETAHLSSEKKMFEARVRSFTFAHELEEQLACATQGGHTPRLLMVLNGDATTLEEVLRYCGQGRGLVLLARETGGLAEALSDYVRSPTGIVPEAWQVHASKFGELKKLNLARRDALAKSGTSARKSGDPDWPLIAITDEVKKAGITGAILDAAMAQAEDVATRVQFAVEWHDDERLATEFAFIPAWQGSRATILRDALQLSLELQHERCVSVCIKNAAPVSSINLLGLYDLLFDEVSPPLIFLFKGKAKPTERLRKWRKSRTDLVNLDNPIYEFYPVEVWQLLQIVVPGLCSYWQSKLDKQALMEPAKAKEGKSGYTELAEADAAAKGSFGPRWLDVYVWAVLLGKTELALSLVTACREPMRAAVVGARLCNEMAVHLPLHSVSLVEASQAHEMWAMQLLDLCESFEEAWRMLVTKSAVWSKPLLHMAVQSDLRPFCSHVQCQLLADEWFVGNDDFDTPSAVLANPDASTLRMMSYMVCPIDFPGFEPMLTWRIPLSMRLEDAREYEQSTPPWWEFYHIPQVKIMVRFSAHLLYTVLISWATINTPMTWSADLETHLTPHAERHIVEEPEFGHDGGGLESYWLDGLLWLWTLALCFDEFYKFSRAPGHFSPDMWNIYDYFTFFVVQGGLFLRFLSMRSSVEAMCFANVLTWMRLFKFLQADYNLGVLVIILMRMTKDIAMWFAISSVVLVAFTVAFVSITNPYILEDSGNHPITAPLWALLGSYDLEEVHDWNQSIGKPMLWLYLVISNVVLVNLLIAMMGYTFSEVKEQADREWKYGRLRTIIETNERFCAIPPPLNLPVTVYTFFSFFARKAITGNGEEKSVINDKEALKEAKKLKGKVARKLLFALKRKIEDEEDSIQATVSASLQEDMSNATMLRELRVATANNTEMLQDLMSKIGGKNVKPPSDRGIFGAAPSARKPAAAASTSVTA